MIWTDGTLRFLKVEPEIGVWEIKLLQSQLTKSSEFPIFFSFFYDPSHRLITILQGN